MNVDAESRYAQPVPYLPPPRPRNGRGETRKVGLELELGRLSLEDTLEIVRATLGGTVALQSRTQGQVEGTRFGTFHVEFDHSILKTRSYLRPLEKLGLLESEDEAGAQRVEDSVLKVAAEIVPVEIVAPPIPWDALAELDRLWQALRAAHAADTHGSLLYAFGLHLNPELPDLETSTRLDVVRAFLLLEDWITEVSQIDLSRRLSPFIRTFPESYRRKVLAADYAPDASEFAQDYIEQNGTRNRPLDLWPLLVHIHGEQLLAQAEEAHLVKGRPTFHYRLPNCDLAQPHWTPARDWNRWVVIERLAADRALLAELSHAYLATLDLPLRLQKSGWVEQLRRRMGPDLLDEPSL